MEEYIENWCVRGRKLTARVDTKKTVSLLLLSWQTSQLWLLRTFLFTCLFFLFLSVIFYTFYEDIILQLFILTLVINIVSDMTISKIMNSTTTNNVELNLYIDLIKSHLPMAFRLSKIKAMVKSKFEKTERC